MLKLILFFILNAYYPVTSIYSLQVNKIDGGVLNFSDYQGKKMLLVNIATGSKFVNQLTSIEDFYEKNKDSIVVIGFPSNDFNNEANTNEQLKLVLQNTYKITFPIIEKTQLNGENANPVFNWLSSEQLNGTMNLNFDDDFQKFFINSSGELIGTFRPQVQVDSTEFLNVIIY